MADRDEEYFVPLQDQRVFGAGIKRKRIAFVPASADSSSASARVGTSSNIGSRYLSIVLPKKVEAPDGEGRPESQEEATRSLERVCAVCKQPLAVAAAKAASATSHESSIAHQVCLEHSHPPSHLDREHVGLKYLSTYGWDPDSRRGLGAREEGIRIPIKAKEKNDTAGLRETEEDGARDNKRKTITKKENKIVRLNGKQLRLQEAQTKKRAEVLRQSFYGPDLEKYLGPNS